jgi:hypothetical protein
MLLISPFQQKNVHYLSAITRRAQQSTPFLSSGMLDDWEDNMVIIIPNRTNGDDQVFTHLGDCVWKEECEVSMFADIFVPYSFL